MNNTLDLGHIFNNLIKYKDKYEDKLIVIKFGGALAEDDEVIRSIGRQVSFLSHNIGAHIIVVHGGGKQINEALKKENITPARDPKTDLRITDEATLKITDQALRSLNGHVVRIFHEVSESMQATGMAGYDARIVTAKPTDQFTGEATDVDTSYLSNLLHLDAHDIVPVIYPVCWNDNPQDAEARLNVNADDVAAIIASRMDAIRLILCSDIPGVLDKEGNLLTDLSSYDVDRLVEEGVVTGGMISKLRAASEAADAIENGGVVILDGRQPSAILKEIFLDEGNGTLIRNPSRIRTFNERELKLDN